MIRSTSVGDVFTKGEFPTVNQEDPISICIELFKAHNEMPPVVAVLGEKGKYVGVVARRWVNRSHLDPSTIKVKSLMKPAPKVEPQVAMSKAANLMIHSASRQLPVYEKNKLLGFVTDENIIHGTVTQEWGNAEIKEIMTKTPSVIDGSRSVGAALTLFREHGVSHLPVLEEGKLAGILSIADVIEQVFQPRRKQTLGDFKGEKVPMLNVPVKGGMTKDGITVQP